ncbi:hypothetical protein Tco_1419125 [Tanacetum coccineum]
MNRCRSAPDAVGDLLVKRLVLVNGVPWVGDGGVSGVSLSVVLSADDKNGEITGIGSILGAMIGISVGITVVSV